MHEFAHYTDPPTRSETISISTGAITVEEGDLITQQVRYDDQQPTTTDSSDDRSS